jgi:hypothetical protein
MQSLKYALFKTLLYHLAVTGTPTAIHLNPGGEKERFVIIPTAADKYYTGAARCSTINQSSLAQPGSHSDMFPARTTRRM